MLTICTPTYNRAHLLPRLYESLCRQTVKGFEWLIVDDGSTDDTSQVCKTFTESFVHYLRQENGGKHRAVNRATKEAKGEWILIVDSDDSLTPNAVELIEMRTKEIEADKRFCGVLFLKATADGQISGGSCPYSTLDTDMLSYRTRYHIRAERAEVLRTDILRAFPFPEFEGEKFCQEALVWNRIARHYLARYTGDIIYIYEYQPDGLSAAVARLLRQSPCGALLYFKEAFSFGNTLPYRYWALGEYWIYHHFCPRRREELFRPSLAMQILRPLTLPYGLIKTLRHRMLRTT